MRLKAGVIALEEQRLEREEDLVEQQEALDLANSQINQELDGTRGSSRRVNSGEVRGYLADVAKSEEAVDLYHQVVAKREAQKQDDVMNSLDIVKKRKIMEAETAVFEDALNDMRNNPEYREQALNDVMRVWESMRMKANDNKPNTEDHAQKPRTPGNGPA